MLFVKLTVAGLCSSFHVTGARCGFSFVEAKRAYDHEADTNSCQSCSLPTNFGSQPTNFGADTNLEAFVKLRSLVAYPAYPYAL